jgi:hypothetical protein
MPSRETGQSQEAQGCKSQGPNPATRSVSQAVGVDDAAAHLQQTGEEDVVFEIDTGVYDIQRVCMRAYKD